MFFILLLILGLQEKRRLDEMAERSWQQKLILGSACNANAKLNDERVPAQKERIYDLISQHQIEALEDLGRGQGKKN